jgi:predicted TIM-barrel fold metal-dependent hydrolase
MIIDINAFIGKWPYWPVRSTASEEVAAELKGWRIDRAAICSTRSIFVHWEDGNREVEEAVGKHPDRFVGFACLGTRELSHLLPRGEYDFESYLCRGFAGIRLYPQHHSYHPLYVSFVNRILEEAESRAWPVMLPHRLIMNWGMPMLDLNVIETLIERHPRSLWILAGINYLHELQLAIRLMKRHRTVHVETSCIMGFEAIAKLVQECGSDQLLFGSGAPIQHGGAGVEKILHARIPDDARAAILGGNAARLLRID